LRGVGCIAGLPIKHDVARQTGDNRIHSPFICVRGGGPTSTALLHGQLYGQRCSLRCQCDSFLGSRIIRKALHHLCFSRCRTWHRPPFVFLFAQRWRGGFRRSCMPESLHSKGSHARAALPQFDNLRLINLRDTTLRQNAYDSGESDHWKLSVGIAAVSSGNVQPLLGRRPCCHVRFLPPPPPISVTPAMVAV